VGAEPCKYKQGNDRRTYEGHTCTGCEAGGDEKRQNVENVASEKECQADSKDPAFKEKGQADIACEAEDKTCQDEIKIRFRMMGL